MTEDTLDVELTKADVAAMDPDNLHSMYAKVRQSRNDMRVERDRMREDLKDAREDNQNLTRMAQAFERQVRERDARLAGVAMQLIDRGVLQLVSLNTGAGHEPR